MNEDKHLKDFVMSYFQSAVGSQQNNTLKIRHQQTQKVNANEPV